MQLCEPHWCCRIVVDLLLNTDTLLLKNILQYNAVTAVFDVTGPSLSAAHVFDNAEVTLEGFRGTNG